MSDQWTVLVADDDPQFRRLVVRILATDELRVETAKDGEEALQKAREVHPDLLLLDIIMPKLDGRDVLARLKSDPMTADIPVIFLTGRGGQQNRLLGLELGAENYIEKPVTPQWLRLKVKRFLRSLSKGPGPTTAA